MSLSPLDWHIRFSRQADWTKSLREYIYRRIKLDTAQDVLEVGCGTGVIAASLKSQTTTHVFGVDINPLYLTIAAQTAPSLLRTLSDAHHLPFPTSSFDISLCHFLLLWVNNPSIVIQEMARVTRRGGIVMALAEPDYGGRIDYPPQLEILGKWQTDSLHQQGADPYIGRRLRSIFAEAGLTNIETGVIGGQWENIPTPDELESEWAVLQSDLEHNLDFINSKTNLKELDTSAWANHQRILFVPTFYTYGRVT
jgi:ubiquinone/menaquinone biosynthesis C-methylase UbiE